MKVLIAVTVFTLWLCSLSFAAGSKLPEDGSVDVQKAADAKKQEGQIGTPNQNAGKQMKEVDKVLNENKKTPVEKPQKGKN